MKKTYYIYVVLSFLVLFMPSCDTTVEPEDKTGTIIGKVTNLTGDTLIAGAIVTTTPSTSIDTTDAAGNYAFNHIPIGSYTVNVSKPGYNDGSVSITVKTNETVTVNIPISKIITSLLDGLLAYYPFNANPNDESGYGNNGTNYGATLTSDRFGNSDKAYYFNGTTSHIIVQHNPSSNFGGFNEYSISIWAKLPPNQNYPSGYFICALCKTIDTAGFNLGIVLSKISSEIRLKNSSGTVVNVPGLNGVGQIIINDNQWHLLSVVVNRVTKNAKLYVDAQLQANVNDPLLGKDISNNSNLYIGGMFFNNQTNGDRFIKGNLDDIRIYNRALSDTEIQNLYHEGGW